MFGGVGAHHGAEIVGQVLLVVHHHHGPAAQHVAGPHDDRIPDAGGHLFGLGQLGHGAVGGLAQVQLLQQRLEAFAVLGAVDGVGAGAQDGNPGPLERYGQIEGRLAAELHDDPGGLFEADDVHHVFESQGFEIQTGREVS